jgi:hypothetical protein
MAQTSMPTSIPVLLLLAVIAVIVPGPAVADPDIDFPIVFTTPQQLAEFGIEIGGAGEVDGQGAIPAFPNLCYDLNGSSVAYREISISNELLAPYRQKGFTRETLCLALVSQARFDPETGDRLPTYVFRDDADIVQSLDADAEQMSEDPDLIPSFFASKQAVFDAISAFKRGDYEQLSEKQTRMLIKNQNAMTEEQPLAVPACFKNGTPYLDCNWKFGLKDGKEVSPAETQRIGELGKAIDRQMKEAIASGQPLGFEGACSTADRTEYLPRCGKISSLDTGMYDGQPEEVRVPQALLNEYRDLTWYDVSPDLPRGYAYAFFARQPADPAFSPAALNPKRHFKKLSKASIKKALARYE